MRGCSHVHAVLRRAACTRTQVLLPERPSLLPGGWGRSERKTSCAPFCAAVLGPTGIWSIPVPANK